MGCGKAPRKTGKGDCSQVVMSRNVRPLVKHRSHPSHAARKQPRMLQLRECRSRNKARKERRKGGSAVLMSQGSPTGHSQRRMQEGPRQLRGTGSCFYSRKTVVD